jgi:hypothetical protein
MNQSLLPMKEQQRHHGSSDRTSGYGWKQSVALVVALEQQQGLGMKLMLGQVEQKELQEN